MGLFSTKKTIVVSSSVYNMAGPEEDRPDFLKSSLFSAIMSPYDRYLGEVVVGNLLSGPGIKQRSFFNWAIRTDFAGLPTFSVRASYPVDPVLVSGQIPVTAPLENVVQSTFAADGEYAYFAEQYLMLNNPTAVNTDYAAEYDAATHTITITYEGGASEVIPGGDFDPNKQVIVAYYYQQEPASVEPLVVGSLVLDTTVPDLTGYVEESLTNTGSIDYTITYDTTVEETWVGGVPADTSSTTTTTETIAFNGTESINTQTLYAGGDGTATSPETSGTETFIHVFTNKKIITDTTVDVVDDGAGKTTTTTVTGDFLVPQYDVRTDTEETIYEKVSTAGAQMFIYTIGTGNAILDALEMDETTTATSEFFPYIPIRLNNVSIEDPAYDSNTGNGLYAECAKAYRKANGNQERLSSLVAQVEATPDLAEIDYAYIVFGVSLNVSEPKCQAYMFQFFKDMIPYQNTTGAYMDGFIAGVTDYNAALATYEAWSAAQNTPLDPLFGTPKPPFPTMVEPESTTIKVKSSDPRTLDYDNRITWISIDEQLFTGVGKVGAKDGDVWVVKSTTFDWSTYTGLSSFSDRIATNSETLNSIEQTHIFKQTGDNTYTRLVIYGLIHRNYIYGGKYVQTTAHEALDDLDTSPFILPLHSPTTRAISLVDSTQMATANTFIVFNSYQIYKKKWYQTFLGMLFIIIAIVIVAAIIAPAAIGGVTGVLGTNAAVGAGLGLTGTAAIVAGAVANALAAIIISTVISTVSIAVFGEKWGAIIAAIASFAVNYGMTNGFSNMTLTSMMTPANLLSLSSALANGYSGMVSADIAEMNALSQENGEKYKSEMEKLEDMIRDLGGSNDLSFDPMQLTDSASGNGGQGSYIPESLDGFIHRTTMTGSDIVDITLSLVTDYAELNRQLPGT